MKNRIGIALVLAICLSLGLAADPVRTRSEYATIRWDGRENTHVVRPSGKVEFVKGELAKIKVPERVNERAFYLNLIINSLAREGYEVAFVVNDSEILMKRQTVP